MSKIEWIDKTWSPITGCTKISTGCQNCYAEKMHKRLTAIQKKPYFITTSTGNIIAAYRIKYRNKFEKVTCHDFELDKPLKWKKPCRIFVCSMSDIFHEDVPFEFIDKIMDTVRKTPQHTYQILTKRPAIMEDYYDTRKIPDNIWFGVTIENKDTLWKSMFIKRIKHHIKFISFEPLLEDIGEIDLKGIDWVIVGGETGKGARPIKHLDWIYNIQRQCKNQNIPLFFKKLGIGYKDTRIHEIFESYREFPKEKK